MATSAQAEDDLVALNVGPYTVWGGEIELDTCHIRLEAEPAVPGGPPKAGIAKGCKGSWPERLAAWRIARTESGPVLMLIDTRQRMIGLFVGLETGQDALIGGVAGEVYYLAVPSAP